MRWLLPWSKKHKKKVPDAMATDTDQKLAELENRVRLIKAEKNIMGRRWYDDPRRRYT